MHICICVSISPTERLKINLVYTLSHNFKIFSNFFVYILITYTGPPTRVPKFSTHML